MRAVRLPGHVVHALVLARVGAAVAVLGPSSQILALDVLLPVALGGAMVHLLAHEAVGLVALLLEHLGIVASQLSVDFSAS